MSTDLYALFTDFIDSVMFPLERNSPNSLCKRSHELLDTGR